MSWPVQYVLHGHDIPPNKPHPPGTTKSSLAIGNLIKTLGFLRLSDPQAPYSRPKSQAFYNQRDQNALSRGGRFPNQIAAPSLSKAQNAPA